MANQLNPTETLAATNRAAFKQNAVALCQQNDLDMTGLTHHLGLETVADIIIFADKTSIKVTELQTFCRRNNIEWSRWLNQFAM